MNPRQISWPTALVVCVAIVSVTALYLAGRSDIAAAVATMTTVAAALCDRLLPKAPPREGGGA